MPEPGIIASRYRPRIIVPPIGGGSPIGGGRITFIAKTEGTTGNSNVNSMTAIKPSGT